MDEKWKVKLMQFGISQEDAEEIWNRGYNLTQLRNNPIKKLINKFSEEKARVWKEKVKIKKIPDKLFYTVLNKSNFEYQFYM